MAASDSESLHGTDNDFVYGALEKLGYSKILTDKRIKICDNAAESATVISRRNWYEDLDIVVPGSRGEGFGISYDCDIDALFVQRSIKCFENDPTELDLSEYPAVFKLDLENVPCGYTWLRKISLKRKEGKNSTFLKNIEEALIERNGKPYLRNDRLYTSAIEHDLNVPVQGWFREQFKFDDYTGPARPFRVRLPFLTNVSVDYVPAFPCSFPSIDKWCSRARKHDWPSQDLIETVKDLDAFVVPVGMKGADDMLPQWRLSFTLAERALVRSFNDIQIKLYAAMKMLAKNKLKSICDDISSYLIKNVVFWVFEEIKTEEFIKDNFCIRLSEILGKLRLFIVKRYLPNYMMPWRNLLENKISEKEETYLVACIDEMTKDVKQAFLCCPLVHEIFVQKEVFKGTLKFRALTEQILAALAAIPPARCEEVEKILHNAKSAEDIMAIMTREVVPFIRENNPFGFFDLLNSMPNEEIRSTLILGDVMEMLQGFSVVIPIKK